MLHHGPGPHQMNDNVQSQYSEDASADITASQGLDPGNLPEAHDVQPMLHPPTQMILPGLSANSSITSFSRAFPEDSLMPGRERHQLPVRMPANARILSPLRTHHASRMDGQDTPMSMLSPLPAVVRTPSVNMAATQSDTSPHTTTTPKVVLPPPRPLPTHASYHAKSLEPHLHDETMARLTHIIEGLALQVNALVSCNARLESRLDSLTLKLERMNVHQTLEDAEIEERAPVLANAMMVTPVRVRTKPQRAEPVVKTLALPPAQRMGSGGASAFYVPAPVPVKAPVPSEDAASIAGSAVTHATSCISTSSTECIQRIQQRLASKFQALAPKTRPAYVPSGRSSL
jgi:hypothetical protein